MEVLGTAWCVGAVWFLLVGLACCYKQAPQPIPLEVVPVAVIAALWPVAAVICLHAFFWDFLEDQPE